MAGPNVRERKRNRNDQLSQPPVVSCKYATLDTTPDFSLTYHSDSAERRGSYNEQENRATEGRVSCFVCFRVPGYLQGTAFGVVHVRPTNILFHVQFTGAVQLILDPWLQIQEPTLHGVDRNVVANFVVDVEKRDAIVKAFKVCLYFCTTYTNTQTIFPS